MKRLLHLVDEAVWSPEQGLWRPPGMEREGFVHLSFPEQLAGTLAVHFSGIARALLLEVDAGRLEDLRLEPSRDGQLFPHLHAPLALDTILRHWLLERGEAGWEPPCLGDGPRQDVPAGRPGAPA